MTQRRFVAAGSTRLAWTFVLLTAFMLLLVSGCSRQSTGRPVASSPMPSQNGQGSRGGLGVVPSPGSFVATSPGDQVAKQSVAAALTDMVPGLAVPDATVVGQPKRIVVMHSDRPREERQLFVEYVSGITLVVLPNGGDASWVRASAESTALAPFVDGKSHQRLQTVGGHDVVVREGGWQKTITGENYSRTGILFQLGKAEYIMYESVGSTGVVSTDTLLKAAQTTSGF